jgi:hypothetical protein
MRRMSTAGDPAATAPPPEGALCASCHTPLLGRYCHACGERVVGPHDFTLKAYFEHVLEEVTHLDGKVWRTLRLLLGKPGRLTTEFLRGRRTLYMRPFTVYVLMNVLFLLITPGHTFEWPLAFQIRGGQGELVVKALAVRLRPADASDAEWAEAIARYPEVSRGPIRGTPSPSLAALLAYGKRFDARAQGLAGSLIFMFVPALAVLCWLLLFRPGRNQPFPKHMVFATHLFAAFLPVFLLLGLAQQGVQLLLHRHGHNDLIRPLLFEGGLLLHTAALALLAYLSLREVHGGRRWAQALRGAAVGASFFPLMMLYWRLLFWVSFVTL